MWKISNWPIVEENGSVSGTALCVNVEDSANTHVATVKLKMFEVSVAKI